MKAQKPLSRVPNAIDLLAVRAVDDSPRVRMEAVRALAATGSPAAVAPAFAALDKPVDRTMLPATFPSTSSTALMVAAPASIPAVTPAALAAERRRLE